MQQSLFARRRGSLVRSLTILLVIVLGTVFFASPVAATPPVHRTWSDVLADPLTGVCDFSIDMTSEFTVNETAFYNGDGVLTGAHFQVYEVDTFTANGTTLVSDPYRYVIQFSYDSAGNLTRSVWNGVLAKVRLPDGGMFITAGWLDWLSHGLGGPIIQPDRGNTGTNLAAFCAALSE